MNSYTFLYDYVYEFAFIIAQEKQKGKPNIKSVVDTALSCLIHAAEC